MKKPAASSQQPVARENRYAFLHWLPATGSRLQAQKGFTLLLAALVASIVLSLGAAVYAIAQKELALSSMGRDSQFAFYAADTAAECALYWDIRCQYFGTVQPSTCSSGQQPPAVCDGQTLTITGDRTTNPYTLAFTYQITVTPPPPDTTKHYCADVTVTKMKDASNAVTSVIHADGFSTGCSDINTDPQALQRSVELHY